MFSKICQLAGDDADGNYDGDDNYDGDANCDYDQGYECCKLTSHDAMQIKISFAAAYDFNQLIHAACSPPRPLPTPQILTPSPPRPALWGRGGSPPRPVP